jgi:hypothetical protein
LCGDAGAEDAGGVFGSGASAEFLGAGEEWAESDAGPGVEDADAFGPVELVGRAGEEVGGDLGGERCAADELGGVGVEGDAGGPAVVVDGGDGLDEAGLVVDPADGAEVGAGEAGGEIVGVDEASGAEGDVADLGGVGELGGQFADGGVFDGGGEEDGRLGE